MKTQDKILKLFKDSTGREYRVERILGGLSISSKQKNGKYKQLNANKGKGNRLLWRYARDLL